MNNTSGVIFIKNREDLIGLGALFNMYWLLLYNIYNNHGIWNPPTGSSLYMILIFCLIIRFIPAYYAYKASNEMNRNILFWSIITYVLPFLGLIILSKLNYKFDNKKEECISILKEFKNKLKKVNYDKYWKEIDKNTYGVERHKLEIIYNNKISEVLSRVG